MRPPVCLLIPLIGGIYLFGILALAGGVHAARRSRLAASWPTAPATFTRLELVEDTSDGVIYRVEVAYTYAVGGVEYQGTELAFGYAGSSFREEHDEVFQKLRTAKTVAVRYNPEKPAESCLSCGVNNSIRVILILGAALLALAVGLTAFFSTTGRWVLTHNLAVE